MLRNATATPTGGVSAVMPQAPTSQGRVAALRTIQRPPGGGAPAPGTTPPGGGLQRPDNSALYQGRQQRGATGISDWRTQFGAGSAPAAGPGLGNVNRGAPEGFDLWKLIGMGLAEGMHRSPGDGPITSGPTVDYLSSLRS